MLLDRHLVMPLSASSSLSFSHFLTEHLYSACKEKSKVDNKDNLVKEIPPKAMAGEERTSFSDRVREAAKEASFKEKITLQFATNDQ